MKKTLAIAFASWVIAGCGPTPAPPAQRGIYHVDAFGAKHDGKSDDGPAIGAAIAACAKTGGVVQFGPGVYVFQDSLVIASSSMILRGVGRANEKDLDRGRGTVLFHRPRPRDAGMTAIRVGHRDTPTTGVVFEDLTLRASTGHSGHLLWMAGTQLCSVERVDLFHNASNVPGTAALYVSCESASAPATGCWFERMHVLVSKKSGAEGHGILIECNADGFTTDLNFLHVKTNNASPPGTSVSIPFARAGVNANHRFVNCRFDSQAGNSGVFVNAPRCSFVNCTLDNPTGRDDLLHFGDRATDAVWIGNVDGYVKNALAGREGAPLIRGRSRAR